ncbi:Hypothetical protein PHPALM_7441 [Phytophthora palmivora]|uniref:ATP-binding cassette (ABC) Superfamily n=1 Tax=Phytophthora palmivora TaxID=4796 RepID=A0A2P4YCB9_9STRA|nr:Hypothetical protein PHPALM_7441 [Phytophthora palmivora]
MFLEHLKAPRGLNHGRTSRGAYERALVQGEPPFVNDIEAARCVLLAPHRIPLKEFTSLRKKPEDRGGLFPIWGAQDERGYGSVNPGTVHRKAAKKPRTTYAPAVDPKSQQPSGSQPGAGLPASMSSVARGDPATSQAAGASQSAAAPGRPWTWTAV